MSDVERRKRDKAMIDDPQRWPHLRLPLKNPSRYNGERHAQAFGYLMAGMDWSSHERVVYHGTIFDPPAGAEASHCEHYEDTDALLDAGWKVD